MTELTLIYIGVAVLLGVHGLLLARRWWSVALLAATLIAFYVGSLDLLSRPKPMGLEWHKPANARVIAFQLDEPHAIYLWMTTGSESEPRAYRLPWSRAQAQRLQDLERDATKGRNGGIAMNANGGDSAGNPRFEPRARPAPPPKQMPRG